MINISTNCKILNRILEEYNVTVHLYIRVGIDFSIGKKRRQRSMQIWSALGTSDGTGGAASADNRTVGGPPTWRSGNQHRLIPYRSVQENPLLYSYNSNIILNELHTNIFMLKDLISIKAHICFIVNNYNV